MASARLFPNRAEQAPPLRDVQGKISRGKGVKQGGLFEENTGPAARPRALVANIDGGSRGNPGPAASGWVIADADGEILVEKGLCIGRETNNRAEYMALLFALEDALLLKADRLTVRSDSELLVRQMKGQYRVKNEGLKGLFERAKEMSRSFKSFTIQHVPREANKLAYAAVNRALDAEAKCR